MDPSIWTRSVPTIVDGQPVDATHTNAPLQVLADRTSALKAILDAITEGEQLVVRDFPVVEEVLEGHVVYLNLETLHQELAQAVYRDLISTSGRLFPDQRAFYTGVVINKSSTYAADILISGYGSLADAAVERLFGEAHPDYGIYYLSALNPGQVQATSPDVAVRVLQYAGQGLVRVFQPDFEPETHTHREYELYAGDWLTAATFPAAIVPTGATFGYDFSSALALAQLLGEALLPAVGEATFVWRYDGDSSSSGSADDCCLGGKHVNEALIRADAQGIWWFGADLPGANIEMTITVADVKGESLLHTIASRTPNALAVQVVNGRVFLTMQEYTRETDTAGSEVVKGIDVETRKLLVGSVVEQVLVGPGLVKSPASGKGTVTFELSLFSDFPIVADLMNLDNAITRSEDPLVFVEFPMDRESKVYLKAPVPYIQDADAYELIIWARFQGSGSLLTGPTVNAYALPKPTATGVAIAAVAGYPAVFPNIPAGILYYELESPVAIDAELLSQGEIYYSLAVDDPAAPIKLLSTGIRLQLKS
jgi:hypothetical protein